MMAAEDASQKPDGFRDTVRALLQGWRAELGAAAREAAASLRRDAPTQTIVDFGPGEIVVSRSNSGVETEIARLPGGHQDGRALAMIFSHAGRAQLSTDIVLRLPQSEVLRANVWLPHARAWTLRKALHFELERLSPVPPDQLYFDFETIGRDKAANRVELALRILRRAVIDQAESTAAAAGLHIASIAFAGDARAGDWQQFPVDRPAFLRLLWRRWNAPALAGLALVLAFAALLAWYARNAEAQDQLSDQIALEQRRATIVTLIERDIARTQSQIGFLARQKQSPLAVGVLAQVTQTLPDGTWLNEIEISKGRVHIRGYSHAAADLLGAIDRSGYFADAQFGAPVVRNPNGNVEQFDINFDVRGGAR
jgi:general secretion pathway protein L